MTTQLRKKLRTIVRVVCESNLRDSIAAAEQISYLLFLKILDEEAMLDEAGVGQHPGRIHNDVSSLFPKQAERYRWSRWSKREGNELRDILNNDVFPYMASLTKEAPMVAEFFRDSEVELDDPSLLQRIVSEINDLELLKIPIDVRSEILELIFAFIETADGKNGQLRTPLHIRSLIISLLDPVFGDKIYDPFCREGGLLVDAAEYIIAKHSNRTIEIPVYGQDWLEHRRQSLEEAKNEVPLQTIHKDIDESLNRVAVAETITGFEISRTMMRLAQMNLLLHRLDPKRVHRGDALLARDGLQTDGEANIFHIILSNPLSILPTSRQDYPNNFPNKFVYLFIEAAMKGLAPGGKCAVFVPKNFLVSQARVEREIRRQLLRDSIVRAVISLPDGALLPHTHTKMSILVFEKFQNDETRRLSRDIVYLIDGHNVMHNRESGFIAESRVLEKRNDFIEEVVHFASVKDVDAVIFFDSRDSGHHLIPGSNVTIVYGSEKESFATLFRKTIRERLNSYNGTVRIVSADQVIKHMPLDNRFENVSPQSFLADVGENRSFSRKKESVKRHVWFFDIKSDGYVLDRSNGRRTPTPEQNDIPELLAQWGSYRDSGYTELPGVAGGSILPVDTKRPPSWWVSLEDIVDNNYDLWGDSYRPQIAEKIELLKPDVLISEILDIESDIVASLKQLLDEIESE